MYSSQLDIHTAIKVFKKYNKQIIIIILSCFLMSALLSSFITKKYTASMVVSQALHDLKTKDKTEQDNIIRKDSANDFEKFLYLLTSNNVALELSKDSKINKNIKPKFSLNSLFLYGKFYTFNQTEAVQNYISKNLLINKVKDSGMQKISIKHSDADFSKYLLQEIYKQSDNLIKEKEREKNEKELSFLKESLQKDNLAENREIFLSLLKRQLQINAMLNVNLPYSADVVENINVSSNPDSPSIMLIILFSTIFLGGLFSALFVYLKENK
jgi:uncharacterized protein involved in exopolysaccharide biosynthesis